MSLIPNLIYWIIQSKYIIHECNFLKTSLTCVVILLLYILVHRTRKGFCTYSERKNPQEHGCKPLKKVTGDSFMVDLTTTVTVSLYV